MKETFRREVIDNLQKNILSYWIGNMVDPDGGFYGRRDGYDRLDENAPKGAILNGRMLWSFSAAYRVLGKTEYLQMAERAKHEIIDKFYDKEYGGLYWSLDAQGNPLDTKKQFYALGFGIYGLSEFARATGDAQAKEYALKLFHDIEKHSRDHVNNGYVEAMQRDWSPIADMRLSDKDWNASKTMNTHLHIIEPYTNLLRVLTPADAEYAAVREATVNLLNLFLDKFMQPNGHLGLFFNDEWIRQDRIISYGHDIEASWLMLECAQVLGDELLLERTLKATEHIATAALEGRCVDGSMVYERHGNGRYDNDKHWWVQAENVIGQMYLACFHAHPEQLERSYQTWRYIADNLVDAEHGEWFWSRKGTEINRADDKAGFWKCPYHNTRMCLEVYERLAD